MRITTKGQVTIPQAFREALGLLPHAEVEFELDGDSVRIRKAKKSTGRGPAIVARMKGTGTSRLSTDQIMRLTRG
jgi:antitoxin PrlF